MSTKPRSPHARVRSHLSSTPLGLAAVLATLVAGSSLAEVPTPDASIEAVRAFVGAPSGGLDPGDPGVLWTKNADSPAGMASTTKTMAMHVVTRAVLDGVIDLDDAATLSANALVPRCHGHSALPGPSTPAPGDQLTIDELLHGTMIPSGSDATLGMAEHLAFVLSPGLATAAEREEYFVGLMNDRAAEMGLADTVFFNPYGGDHLHVGSCGGGAAVAHQTTAREMAKWFAVSMQEDPVFRDVVGYRGQRTLTTQDGTKTFSLATWNPGYPGMQGQKGGSNASCASCLVGQARRIGRDVVVSYLQSTGGSGDGTELLDYAYASTFEPRFMGASAGWGPASDRAVAAVAGNRAVAAVLSQGQVDLVAWDVDADEGDFDVIANGFSGPCAPADLRVDRGGLAGGPGLSRGASVRGVTRKALSPGTPRGVAWGRDDDDDRDGDGRDDGRDDGRGGDDGDDVLPGRGRGSGTTGGLGGGTVNSPWSPRSLDLVHVGNRLLVLAVETPHAVALSIWGVPPCGKPFQVSAAVAEAGRDVVLQPLRDGLFALVVREDDSTVRVETWSVDLSDGELSEESIWETTASPALRVVTAAHPYGVDGTHLLLGLETASSVRLEGFHVDAFGITSPGGLALPGGTGSLSLAAVPGEDGSHAYVAAGRGVDGMLQLRVYRWDGAELVRVGSDDGTAFPMEEWGVTAVASHAEGGVMVAIRPQELIGDTTLAVYALDEDPLDPTPSSLDANFVISSVAEPGVGEPQLVRLPTGRAEGDFLLVLREGASQQTELKLQLHRSGERY